MSMRNTLSAVAVFAHNEERHLHHCLDALDAAGRSENVPVYVLANGCTDRTVDVARDYAARRPNIVVIEIAKGDKANAWNVFVHEHAPQEGFAAFVDGDVTPAPESITRLVEGLIADETAHVASAVPFSGRNRDAQVHAVLASHGVQGNLYVARAAFLDRIRRQNIRMPVGFVREDGLIGALAKWDLDPVRQKWRDERVLVVPQSGFNFDSIPMASASGWRQYLRRRVRYSVGHFETGMLRDVLKTVGAEGMPTTVEALYASADLPQLSWRGVDTLFDWLALRSIGSRRLNSMER